MSDMLKDHKKDVADFARESKTAHDPDVKNFAVQTLPTLEDHLKLQRYLLSGTSLTRAGLHVNLVDEGVNTGLADQYVK
jgi:hypothetical protein